MAECNCPFCSSQWLTRSDREAGSIIACRPSSAAPRSIRPCRPSSGGPPSPAVALRRSAPSVPVYVRRRTMGSARRTDQATSVMRRSTTSMDALRKGLVSSSRWSRAMKGSVKRDHGSGDGGGAGGSGGSDDEEADRRCRSSCQATNSAYSRSSVSS